MDAKDKMILELVENIEEFITNHPKENNENYEWVVKGARKIIAEAEARADLRNKAAQDLFKRIVK